MKKSHSWPGGAKAVMCVTVHMDGPAVEAGLGLNPLGINSCGRYSARKGVPRYLDILDKHSIRATFFMCGYDVELYPALMREVHARGHEIAAHGYMHEGWDPGEAEPALLEKTHKLISDAIGVEPVGWCSPSGRKSARTLPTLKRLGYRYDASEKDEDLPYLASIDDRQVDDFVILPNNTVSLDDVPLYREGQALPSEVLQSFLDEFHVLHEGDGYIHLSVHPKASWGSGVPARANVVDRFLAEARNHPDVAFLTLAELADFCLAEPDLWRDPRK